MKYTKFKECGSSYVYYTLLLEVYANVLLYSLVDLTVSMMDCKVGDPGSIPDRGQVLD